MRNVLNALDVLSAVSTSQPAGVGQLSRDLDLPKSTVQRALLTLAQGGWIRPVGTEMTRWVLTTKALVVGTRAASRDGVRDAGLPVMHRLRAEINETVNLTRFDGDFAVLIERLDSTHTLRTFAHLGVQAPLHASAAGRAILSHLPDDVVAEKLARGLPQFTPTTLTDPDALLDRLRRARERGYEIAASEWNPGVFAVASAIVLTGGDKLLPAFGVIGAIGISGPEQRMPESRLIELGPTMAGAAKQIARSLDGSSPSSLL